MQPRAHRNAGFVQQGLSEGIIVDKALVLHCLGDVREQVERGIRPEAAHAFDGVENLHRRVAPLLEGCQNLLRLRLVSGEPFNGSVLDEVVRAGLVVDVELGDDVDDLFRPDGSTKTPSGHCELFREGIENHAPLSHTWQGCQ